MPEPIEDPRARAAFRIILRGIKNEERPIQAFAPTEEQARRDAQTMLNFRDGLKATHAEIFRQVETLIASVEREQPK